MKISVIFLYSINEQLETDIKLVTYAIASKIIKYLESSLAKCVQELYTKKCKTLLREIKD